MKKARIILISSLLVLTVILSACGKADVSESKSESESKSNEPSTSAEADSAPAKKVKVTLAYWNKEESVKTLLQLVKDKLPDVDLQYQFIDNKQYNDIVKTQLAAGEGPDIISGLMTDPNLVQANYFEDLTARFGGKYYDSGTENVTYNGKLYGLPQASWFNGLFYNVDLFDKYNLKVPKTLDEYFQVAETFIQNGIKPQAIAFKDMYAPAQSFIALALNDYMGTPEGKDFSVAFGKGEMKMADVLEPVLNTWTEYIKRGIFTKEMLGIDGPQALDEFASGKAAMYQSGAWDMETIKKKSPNMKIDMFPNLGTKGGPGWMVGGPGVSFGINKSSEVKEAAFKVLDLLSTPEGQKAYWQDNQGGSSFLKDVTFEMPEQYNGAQEAFKAGNVIYPPNVWGVGRDTTFAELGKGLQDLVAGSKTPHEVLVAADKKQQEMLSKTK
ncbi:MAG: extracellular solute-binding protein [Paenibacillaceae bacterium]